MSEFMVNLNEDERGESSTGERRHRILQAEEEVDLAKTIEAAEIAETLLELLDGQEELPTATEFLSQETLSEYESLEKLRDDLETVRREGKEARATFFECNMGLVALLVKRRAWQGSLEFNALEEDDFIMEVAIRALPVAIEKFDYKKGLKFSTYAGEWVFHFIRVVDAEMNQKIPVKRTVLLRMKSVISARNSLKDRLGREPSDEEISDAIKDLGLQAVRNAKALYLMLRGVSLDATISLADGDGSTIEELLVDTEPNDTSHIALSMLEIDTLHEALEALPPIHRDILLGRYGFKGEILEARSVFCKRYGMSEWDVIQTEKEALSMLKERVGRYGREGCYNKKA